MTIQCAACGKPTVVPDIDRPHIVNLPAASVITVQHAEQVPCEHCGRVLTLSVSRLSLQFVGIAAPQKPVIVVPSRIGRLD